MGKLIYLIATRSNITFIVSAISQYMQSPRQIQWEAACRILRYLKQTIGMGVLYKRGKILDIVSYSDADWAGSKSDKRLTGRYCNLIDGNLVTWRIKKQNIVVRSCVEAEYHAMAHIACQLMWLRNLLKEFGITIKTPLVMYCDNQAATYIASHPIFHEKTKHIEIDCHFIREVVMTEEIVSPYIMSEDQIGDLFTKVMHKSPFLLYYSKLSIENIYTQA